MSNFGTTDMTVGPLGLGAAEIGFGRTSDKTVSELLSIASDAGMNVIDTAAMYGDSEAKIGKALKGKRNRFLLFTKCGALLPPRLSWNGFILRSQRKMRWGSSLVDANSDLDYHPRVLQWNIEQSLRRLKTDCIDLIQLHSCSERILRQGDAIDVLHRARKAGKARYVGYSSDGKAAAYAIQCGQFDAVQIAVNIADQGPLDTLLPLATQFGLGVIVKRPIANGLWKAVTRPEFIHNQAYWDRFRSLRYDFLEGDRDFETALRFTLTAPGVHTAIIGTANPQHLRQNVQYAARGALGQQEFAMIRARWRQVSVPEWTNQV